MQELACQLLLLDGELMAARVAQHGHATPRHATPRQAPKTW